MGLNGRKPCSRWMKYAKMKLIRLKAIERRRVLGPALLGIFTDAAEAVGELLQGAQHGMKEGPLALKKLVMKTPKGLVTSRISAEINQHIQNANRGHGAPLRTVPAAATRKPDKPKGTER